MINDKDWKEWDVIKREGDLHQWTDTATKYQCRILRNSHLGFWLGYVDIPKSHPYYGLHYDKITYMEVHGGLTYTSFNDDEKRTFWRLGFDCGHAGDYIPAFGSSFYDSEETYRTKEYVINEVTLLALQLYNVAIVSLSEQKGKKRNDTNR